MFRPLSVEIDDLPGLLPFKYARTEYQVFTHPSYFARPTTFFEDPPNDPSPDNEVFKYIGESVLSMAVGLLTKKIYRACARPYFIKSRLSSSAPHCS